MTTSYRNHENLQACVQAQIDRMRAARLEIAARWAFHLSAGLLLIVMALMLRLVVQ